MLQQQFLKYVEDDERQISWVSNNRPYRSAQAPLTPSNWSALYRGRGSPVMSGILLKANNAQQSSGGCAGFNVRSKIYLVLIFIFNSTNEYHINLYTWHMSHATYKFLLLALTWDLITQNRQSILRDTRTSFSLPPVIVSLRIEHWCFIFRWTCSPNVNTKQDCFLQKEARVCVRNAFVLKDSMFK